MSFEDIKNIIYRYYPKSFYNTEPGYQDTVEFKRLVEVCSRAGNSSKLWADFLTLLRDKFGGYEIEDWTQLFHYDPCYRCKINLLEDGMIFRSLIVHVSIIAPLGSIYLSEVRLDNGRYTQPKISFKPITLEDQKYFSIIYSSLKEVFGYELLPIEQVMVTVSDIAVRNQLLNESTVFHCLFTDHII